MLIPVPKSAELSDELVTLADASGAVTVDAAAAGPLQEACLAALSRALEPAGGRLAPSGDDATIKTVLAQAPEAAGQNSDQWYRIEIADDCVLITAGGHAGALWAFHTLARLLRPSPAGPAVPRGTIEDWPDTKWRGLFCESRWGPDLMTLDDWKAAVDYLADLKMNILTVGVYNCWPIQYYGRVSEWLMVPIRALPQLRSPQIIEYYSALRGEWVKLEYLPRMFEEDFFGELVAYGASRGVLIRPHFNTPGHNTLIPRLIPEISAKDEDGNPTGYGFCIHNPKTYEVMFTIVDEICQRYLLPNGVRSYHIAGDEVYPLRGMNPDRPHDRISPWCRCPECRKYSEAELYVEYIVRLASHLREIGVQDISMWYDQLVRGGQLNEDLARRLEQAGIRDAIILHWWQYWHFFDTTHPELGFRRFVTPMTGYFYQTPYRGQLQNIYEACELGGREGAVGAESYGLFDRSFDRHFRQLAEMAWNAKPPRTPEQFMEIYAREVFGDDWQRGLSALRIFSTLVDSLPVHRLTYSMFRYSHDYAQTEEQATARDNYPQHTVLKLAASSPQFAEGLLAQVSAEARRAEEIFASCDWRREDMRPLYIIECRRMALMADALAACVSIARQYEEARVQKKPARWFADTDDDLLIAGPRRLRALLEQFDELFAMVEREKDHYLVPHFLRELSFMRRFLTDFATSLDTVAADAREGHIQALPELEVLRVNPVKFAD